MQVEENADLSRWYQIQAAPKFQLNLYHTENDQNGHCLQYSTYDDAIISISSDGLPFPRIYHMISYCFRPSEKNHSANDFDYKNTIDSSFTFAELKQRNITSQMLLSWSASINMAEQYQIFLNNYSNSFNNNVKFYNCNWISSWCSKYSRLLRWIRRRRDFKEFMLSKSRFRMRRTYLPTWKNGVFMWRRHMCQRSAEMC